MRRQISYMLLSSLLAILLGVSASAKIIDEDGPYHPILRPLAETLDRVGVDVILGRSADFETSARPRLTPLEGFENNRGSNWGDYWGDVWIEGFEKGLIGAVLATARGEQQPPNVKKEIDRCRDVPAKTGDVTCDFLEGWLAAPEGKRLFIAFTRSDLDAALAVQAALRSEGYAAFVYLRKDGEDPWAHPDFVGAVFAKADHRLVIDTQHSRGSEGVQFEATCVQALTPKRDPKDTRWLQYVGSQ